MNFTTIEKLLKRYRVKTKTFKDLNYGSEVSQEVRFKIFFNYLEKFGMFGEESINLFDWGCGYCDFYKFLKTNAFDYYNINYHGSEINQDLIVESLRRFPELNGYLFKTDIIPDEFEIDVAVAIGTFSSCYDSKEDMYNFVFKEFSKCKRMLIVNFQSKFTDDGYYDNDCNIIDPSVILSKAFEHTPYVILDHSYYNHCFTIVLIQPEYFNTFLRR